jgi:hypothetical protein
MNNAETKIIDTKIIESRFIFSQSKVQTQEIIDCEGKKLAFHRSSNGNQFVFAKDEDGHDVAVEHCVDGSKVYHISQDSKGLPAMHEFRPDGGEVMYLLDSERRLEKIVENKLNGDKVSTWFYTNEIVSQEQRQTSGMLFKIFNSGEEALIWLHVDGTVSAYGSDKLIERLKNIFMVFLDGAEF